MGPERQRRPPDFYEYNALGVGGAQNNEKRSAPQWKPKPSEFAPSAIKASRSENVFQPLFGKDFPLFGSPQTQIKFILVPLFLPFLIKRGGLPRDRSRTVGSGMRLDAGSSGRAINFCAGRNDAAGKPCKADRAKFRVGSWPPRRLAAKSARDLSARWTVAKKRARSHRKDATKAKPFKTIAQGMPLHAGVPWFADACLLSCCTGPPTGVQRRIRQFPCAPLFFVFPEEGGLTYFSNTSGEIVRGRR